jgi:hypothetical protein
MTFSRSWQGRTCPQTSRAWSRRSTPRGKVLPQTHYADGATNSSALTLSRGTCRIRNDICRGEARRQQVGGRLREGAVCCFTSQGRRLRGECDRARIGNGWLFLRRENGRDGRDWVTRRRHDSPGKPWVADRCSAACARLAQQATPCGFAAGAAGGKVGNLRASCNQLWAQCMRRAHRAAYCAEGDKGHA